MTILLLLLWIIASFVLMFTVIWYGYQDFSRAVDVIIVLGAGVEADGRPSQTLRVRAERGAELWRMKTAPVIICTGGIIGGSPRSEADACREVLLQEGVPPDAVLLEDQSINTFENARYSLSIMAENNFQDAVVVSSRYHLLRARWLFWQANAQVYTSPARINYLAPSEILYVYTREWAAFHWQIMRQYFKVPHIYVPVP